MKIDNKQYKAFNLNDKIKVKFTQKGRTIYLNYMLEIQKSLDKIKMNVNVPIEPEIDNEGYTELVLWDFMEIFGSHMFNGQEPLIENMLIYIPDDNLREK